MAAGCGLYGNSSFSYASKEAGMRNIEKILQERGAIYGSFDDVAEVLTDLMDVMQDAPGWSGLGPKQRVAVIMIQMKLSRILCGASHQPDSWRDIAGYAMLAE